MPTYGPACRYGLNTGIFVHSRTAKSWSGRPNICDNRVDGFRENQVAWYAYGYFVWTPNGVVHSGHDFGPTLDTYKVGDSLGVRSGVEGIVIGILKGEAAKKSGGYDVFVLVDHRAPRPDGAPAVAVQDFFQTHAGERLRRILTGDNRLVSRPQIQAVHGRQEVPRRWEKSLPAATQRKLLRFPVVPPALAPRQGLVRCGNG